jgi:hypothetical protein
MTLADYTESDAQISYAAVCMMDDPDDGSFLGDDEVACVDCGCALPKDSDGRVPRCDTDEAHRTETCGEDCPVICEVCVGHHFAPYCGGASRNVLRSRAAYGGRKGRSAKRRLDIIYRKLGWG